MRDAIPKTDFASVKLARPFVAWLKREAARRGIPMYELVEELASRGMPVRPWSRGGRVR